MKSTPKAINFVGRAWIWAAIACIIVFYILNLIYSNVPLSARILIFTKFVFVFPVLLILIPGYLLTELAEKIANKNGDTFNKQIEGEKSKKPSFLSKAFDSKIVFSLAIAGYLILAVFFIISNNK